MNEMVKRVARSMASLRNDAEGDEAIMDLYGDLARAAIAAMHTPTHEMMGAAIAAGYDPSRIWWAMIDAALVESQE